MDDIDSVRVQEIVNYSHYDQAWVMRDLFGFGQPLDYQSPLFTSGALTEYWGGVVTMVADALRLELDEIREVHEFAAVDRRRRRRRSARSRRAPSPRSASRCRGSSTASPSIVVEHDTRIHDDAAPDWPQCRGGDNCYRVLIEGRPRLTCELDMEDEHGGDGGLIACSMRVVNAIPAVCAAPPGAALDPRPAASCSVATYARDDHQGLDFRPCRYGTIARPEPVTNVSEDRAYAESPRARLRRDLVARSRRLAGVRDQCARSRGRVRQRRASRCSSRWTGTITACRCTPATTEDVAFVGWEVGSAENMQALAAQLDAADIEVTAAQARSCRRPARRRLRALRRPAQRDAHGAALRPRGRVLAAVPPAAADHRLQDRRTRDSGTS